MMPKSGSMKGDALFTSLARRLTYRAMNYKIRSPIILRPPEEAMCRCSVPADNPSREPS